MTDTGYSRSPKLLKGALIQFSAAMIIPVPNVILFQYNPELMSRSVGIFDPKAAGGDKQDKQPKLVEGRLEPYDPEETFSMQLYLNATDALEEPESHPVAVVSGVADRLAALEMMLYPAGEDSLLGGALGISVSVSLGAGGASLTGGAGAAAKVVPRRVVPVALFVWGPGRIVPVRITSFAVEEQQFNFLLYPTRAKVSLGMRVLTPEAILGGRKSGDAMEEIAIFAYKFTRAQKEVLALANLANTVESILGMLPF